MPSPKNGTPGTVVPPASPNKAQDADDANPGQVEQVKAQQRQTQTGKYGSTPVKPYKKPTGPDEAPQNPSWIEIVLLDEESNPVAGETYRVTLPDESVAEGTLDGNGFARVDGFDAGSCQVTFPNLDQDAWRNA